MHCSQHLNARSLAGLPLLVVLAHAVLSPAASAQEVLRHRTGPGLAGLRVVVAAGDVDGDGIDDTLVGTPGDGTAGALAGSARVYSGADDSLLLVLTGGGPGAQFGASAASAGDLDGDGRGDLIVGAPGVSRAYVHSGIDGSLLHALQGVAGDRFGHAVAGVGDVDGDGTDDVAIGAPEADVGGDDTGSVSVVSGATGATLYAASGGEDGDLFGTSLAGDPDGSCMADNQGNVIVGATAGGGSREGYVQARSTADFSIRWQVAGGVDEQLGIAVVQVGDVDGDGVTDVAAGTDPRDAFGLAVAPSVARLYSGADGTLLREHADGLLGSGLGTVLAAIGDVTGDGVPDLGVGAPYAGANGTDSGTVHLYSGADGSTWYTIHGSAAGARLGAALAYADDIDAAGTPDVAVGAPGAVAGSERVWVFSVSRWDDAGSGMPGVEGIPSLSGEGGLVGSVEATLTLSGARASTTATLVLGLALVVDSATNTLVPTADAEVSGMLTDNQGDLTYAFEWPEGFPSGTTVYHQFLISDPAAPGGVSRSNAVAATVP
ncbi:MAG: hypothetical protein ACYTG2_12405 [Planctomycetota bacterium]|jgi:hypothetical protein